MITDKEYPATHSMSTAWYAADEDGNVAIIDYNENGPVPWIAKKELGIESIVFGDDMNVGEEVSLTDEQIDEILGNCKTVDFNDADLSNCMVLIDTAKEKDFMELAEKENFEIVHCLSKRRGLYYIDGSVIKGESYSLNDSAIQRMFDDKLIVKFYEWREFYINDDWEDGKVVFEKDFDNLPYFVYGQPYWTDDLPERLNVPSNPVKLSQFPDSLRRRIPILPIKFSEKKNFQIAEWVPCNFYSTETVIFDEAEYILAKLTDGSEAYVLTDLNAPVFLQHCSERETYQCEECVKWAGCFRCFSLQFSSCPTVMQVISPLERVDYKEECKDDVITLSSIWLSFLQKIPKNKVELNAGKLYSDVSRKQLEDFYLKSYRYLEDKIDCFKPRVLILDELSEEVMSKKYGISNGKITICGVEYPVFKSSEIESRRTEIEALALLPYRGKKIPHIITVEEMKKLKGE